MGTRAPAAVLLACAMLAAGCRSSPSTDRAVAPTTTSPATAPATTIAPATTATAPATTAPATTAPATTAPATTAPATNPAGCPAFDGGALTGRLANPAITEASGLAASHRNAGVLWAHNDSGDTARVFATDATGADLGTFALAGAGAIDWEDIAVGPGPDPATSYVYAGDIGGNSGRNAVTVYRVAEPSVPPGAPPAVTTLDGVARLDAVYPGGGRFDAESLFIDPRSTDLYIVTKSLDGLSRVLRWPATAQTPGVTATLEEVATHRFAPPSIPMATGADISPDGTEVVVRTYDRVFLWRRPAGTSVAAALAQPPCGYPVPAGALGEAVAFTADGRDLVLTTEGAGAPVHTLTRG